MVEKKYRDAARKLCFELVKNAVAPLVDDAMDTAPAAFTFPYTDSEGNEMYAVVTVQIPTGTRGTNNMPGEEYDGYAAAEDYRIECEQKAEKERLKAEAKAKKIEKDKAKRTAKKKEKGSGD